MRVLVACEYSGRVRQAFRDRGHDAYSCDLLPCEDQSRYHLTGDALEWIDLGCPPDPHSRDISRRYWLQPWDMLIAFPPCTYLTNSGERWMKNNPERQERRRQAVEFVKALMAAPIKLKAFENPVGHLSSAIRKPDQIIQPWMFGHPENKGTCLWLENLPPLKETNNVKHLMMLMSKAEQNRIHYMPPGPDRWKERSRTFQGIADAMADQWGSHASTVGDAVSPRNPLGSRVGV